MDYVLLVWRIMLKRYNILPHVFHTRSGRRSRGGPGSEGEGLRDPEGAMRHRRLREAAGLASARRPPSSPFPPSSSLFIFSLSLSLSLSLSIPLSLSLYSSLSLSLEVHRPAGGVAGCRAGVRAAAEGLHTEIITFIHACMHAFINHNHITNMIIVDMQGSGRRGRALRLRRQRQLPSREGPADRETFFLC